MADRVVLHIGPRKTATTYLQRALQALEKSGQIPRSLYPVRTRGRLDHNQVPGLIDLARSLGEIALQEDAWRHQDGSDAQELIDTVRDSPGTVILSAEALSVMRDSGATSVISAFQPAPVEVVVTLRDLARVLPSSWQQHVRNGNIEDFPTYLELRREERESREYLTTVGRAFWRAYLYGDLVRRWQSCASSVSVVTVPTSSADPAEVWRRFRAAGRLQDDIPAEPPEVSDDVANVSLTGAETYVLHGFNLAAREAGAGRREVRQVHRRLLKGGWSDRGERGPRLGLPEAMHEQVRAWADEDRADLAGVDVDLYGSLDDLNVTMVSAGSSPGPEAVAEAAGAALDILRRGSTAPLDVGDDED